MWISLHRNPQASADLPEKQKPPPAPGEVLKALDIEHLFAR